MNKADAYEWAGKRVRAQILRHIDLIATLANTTAILKEYLPNFFWVGFYFVKDDHLMLGPFQGPPACVRLTMDKGVCATCVQKKEIILVPDVEKFPGHIVCDARFKSEIVVPVFDNHKRLRAVLDVDSVQINDFDDKDVIGLGKTAQLLDEIWP